MKHLICLLCWFATCALHAQPITPDLFDSDEVLDLYLRFDHEALLADRSDTAAYLPATLQYTTPEGLVSRTCRIRVRGNFRRRPDICDFPPLGIRMTLPERTGTPFAAHPKLKLVTHCQDDALVLREYLVYRQYQLLTPYSFRTRLLRVHYEDTAGLHPPTVHWAFAIEDDKTLAARLGGHLVDTPVAAHQLRPDNALDLYLFQYMIGNQDWDIYFRKNIEVIRLERDGTHIAVPFDFDWSRIVHAPYTGLEDDYAWRLFRPICCDQATFETARARWDSLREPFKALYKDFVHLPAVQSRDAWAYCREFYDLLHQPATVAQVFLGGCR
ncbi:MAG: hypothetical protein OHK0039_26600 [Bacteroidia bacterium]